MNEVIKQLMEHRSIRKFTDVPLDQSTVKLLVEAAQHASTSSFVQAYSIIGVTDPDIKHELSLIGTQNFIEHNGHLFVFVADFKRHQLLSERAGLDAQPFIGATERFIVGTVDASLAAQNLAVAAESMGLGICYVGGLRNDMAKVIELLKLPEFTYPLFGMVAGYPAQQGSKKERLPFDHVYHENRYVIDGDYMQQIEDYDRSIAEYYRTRTAGERVDTWSQQMVGKVRGNAREEIDSTVKRQGFLSQK
ncbi:oxygen-insensitive NADPH nitroreductase [Macrococcus lamae]|uniref:NADPH-dependent oxidoreductase n=1 Tax=Macrococcus lamae TaxID=198484 RepID=A0A4R6BSU5_9STAP|nr:oxygen-insensitive NADPH nitroreductase [Macrococcus lamae]TDM07451.1 oxygen-insensitive NADPH nitroreductase [Macrococcus lamae]